MKHWLVTYEWRRLGPGAEWRRENVLLTGDVGLWWAAHIRKHQEIHDAAVDKATAYKARGEPVPICDRVYADDQRFICATPITEAGFEALKTEAVGDVQEATLEAP